MPDEIVSRVRGIGQASNFECYRGGVDGKVLHPVIAARGIDGDDSDEQDTFHADGDEEIHEDDCDDQGGRDASENRGIYLWYMLD